MPKAKAKAKAKAKPTPRGADGVEKLIDPRLRSAQKKCESVATELRGVNEKVKEYHARISAEYFPVLRAIHGEQGKKGGGQFTAGYKAYCDQCGLAFQKADASWLSAWFKANAKRPLKGSLGVCIEEQREKSRKEKKRPPRTPSAPSTETQDETQSETQDETQSETQDETQSETQGLGDIAVKFPKALQPAVKQLIARIAYVADHVAHDPQLVADLADVLSDSTRRVNAIGSMEHAAKKTTKAQQATAQVA